MWCELDAVLCGCSQGRPVNEKTSRRKKKKKREGKRGKQKTTHPLVDEAVPLHLREPLIPLGALEDERSGEKKSKI